MSEYQKLRKLAWAAALQEARSLDQGNPTEANEWAEVGAWVADQLAQCDKPTVEETAEVDFGMKDFDAVYGA